ncbi:related to guanine nucleotide-binding protein [Phialocephala subalpina]|uniref:Related to guanine nucleotide-binding protein n=1 Tax=Phialocephala subalpina TaxID=576137 RepID=A0A1L7XED5_9HELO|nr:related to guanine nucleotide-binding protein [Phialocephala subalpina]
MEEIPKIPNLVASTGDSYCGTIAESRKRESTGYEKASGEAGGGGNVSSDESLELNYFKSAQWTPDGTTLLTSSADNTIRSFILPPDLLNDPSSTKTVAPYTKHAFPSSINCLAPYPLFNLSDPSTTLYLSAPTDFPIRLANTLSPDATAVSTYNLVSLTTEAWHTPASILWSSPGHFLTGTDCLISLFDVSRNGEGPITRMPTIPSKRHLMKGGGVGIRGIASALSQQSSEDGTGILAAGTWTRSIGLYDTEGTGGTVSVWNVKEAADEIAGIGGTGVTQTVWSPCGRYLLVVERKSRGVLVYDVRVEGKLVAWLEGREADTNQRLSVDVFQGEKGMEVWAGGVDGIVGVWEGVGTSEGAQKRSWEWAAHNGRRNFLILEIITKGYADPIGSTAMHPSGSVVATCSGQRGRPHFEEDSDGDESNDTGEDSSDEGSHDETSPSVTSQSRASDNTLKIWSI